MVRALLLALTWAAVASAPNYVDYAGIKMPSYGGNDYDIRDPPRAHPSEDYHVNSPEASASSDYKDEEEARSAVENRAKESKDSGLWRKPGRKQRELAPIRDAESKTRNFIIQDDNSEMSKSRLNRVNSKHRPRLKDDVDTDESPVPRRHNPYGRNRKLTVSKIDTDTNSDKDYQPNDKVNEFDHDLIEEDKSKPDRRNFKDRLLKRPSDDPDYYDERSRQKSDNGAEVMERKPPTRYQPALVQHHPVNVAPVKMKLREYNDYDDYYDMKRVNLKNKLPSLIQRTTVRGVPSGSSPFLLNMLRTKQTLMLHINGSATSIRKPTFTTPITISELSSSSAATPEMSIAERSRLSILKKQHNKEGVMVSTTKKPAVLMQVTKVMPTVVLVAQSPSTPESMTVEVREDDSPEKIERVKKLMRDKLVKEAKNIHDLTSNWDHMVCDYIDVSLVRDSGVVCSPSIWLFIACLLVSYIKTAKA